MRDSLDYDLIIIGSSWEGIYAAKVAVQLQARVALVTQCNHGNYLINEALINRSLSEFAALNYQLVNSPLAAIAENKIPNISLAQANNWTININSITQTQNSLAGLAALGVDVIVGMGEFYRLPKLGLQVNKRKLRSRHFLLATGSVFKPQFLSELSNSYLTLQDWDNNKLTQLPDNIIVVGSDPIALEFAQTLTRFGKKITLVVKHSRILPQEDLEIATLIQAQLEAEGINIVTNSEVSQIKIINNQKWLQASDRALFADEIIIADYRQPNIAGLNLAGVEVKYNQQRVYVNQKLQTTNPNIYACGDLIGGYCLPSIAQYEVGLILKNTLFFPWYKTNYYPQPWAILTQPNLARVGLNERQARQKYGENIYILKQYYNQVAQAQISDKTTGLCKLIVLENGTIIGCSLIGDRAADVITVISLMMQHQIKLDSNPMRGLTSISIPTIYPTMTEILHHVSNDFYQQKLQRHPNLLKRLQTWFAWRK